MSGGMESQQFVSLESQLCCPDGGLFPLQYTRITLLLLLLLLWGWRNPA
jgi:hypothetical protein